MRSWLIDRFNEQLPELRSFVLPGGGSLGSYLHLCRTVCRRAERLTVALSRRDAVPGEAVEYLNRLSDALFVFARHAARITGAAEISPVGGGGITGGGGGGGAAVIVTVASSRPESSLPSSSVPEAVTTSTCELPAAPLTAPVNEQS